MNGGKHIPIEYVCSTDNSESKEFLVDEKLLQVCSTDKGKSKRVIIDESYMEDSESECVHKSANKEKYAKNEAEHEDTLVKDNPVVKEPIYFNIIECVNNILNKLDAI